MAQLCLLYKVLVCIIQCYLYVQFLHQHTAKKVSAELNITKYIRVIYNYERFVRLEK